MNSEFSEILADVKEQILYLQELGVENLSVELPEITFSPKSKVQSPKSEVRSLKFRRKNLSVLFRPREF